MSSLRATQRLYFYAANVVAAYDGDTVTVDIDLGHGIVLRDRTIRLFGVDCPEVRGKERKAGLEARDETRRLVLGRDVLIRTYLDPNARDRAGKFGRLLAEVFTEVDGGLVNVNRWLVENGHARLETYGDRFDGWTEL